MDALDDAFDSFFESDKPPPAAPAPPPPHAARGQPVGGLDPPGDDGSDISAEAAKELADDRELHGFEDLDGSEFGDDDDGSKKGLIGKAMDDADAAASGVAQPEKMQKSKVVPDAEILEHLRTGFFGVFRLTPTKGTKFGGYEAECPFHKRNEVSGCKKRISMSGPGEQERLAVVKRLMWWCTMADTCNRQREHICKALPIEECPCVDSLLQLKVDSKPAPKEVLTDGQLDAAEVGN